MPFHTRMDESRNVFIIEIPERLNMANADELKTPLNQAVEAGHYNIVLDMMKTRYVDSTGLSAILSRISALRASQGDVRLAFQADFIRELLSITNLDKILQYYESVEDAVQSFG